MGREGPSGLRIMPVDTSPSGKECFSLEKVACQGDHVCRRESRKTVLRCELTLRDAEQSPVARHDGTPAIPAFQRLKQEEFKVSLVYRLCLRPARAV